MKCKSSCERGSAFWLILIATAMFAALSFIMMQDSRTNVGSLSKDQAKLAAQEILSNAENVGKAVQALRLRGCTDTQISFETPAEGWLNNPNAPSDKSCHVFDPNGGKLSRLLVRTEWRLTEPTNPYWWYNGEHKVGGMGTNAPELTLFSAGIRPEICNELNQIVMGKDMAFESTMAASTSFTGTYVPLADGFGDDPGSIYNGKPSGCADLGGGYYTFYSVLIAR